MKLLLIIWINFMVILAVVFTWTYLQRATNTLPSTTLVHTSVTLAPSPKQNTPVPTAPTTVSQKTSRTFTRSTSSILVNPFTSPKISSTQKISPETSVAPQTASPPQTKTPTLSSAQIQEKLALGASKVRGALVNILCVSSIGGALHSISGSGIIINPQGVILTNAHIAQYFLLKDYPHKGDTSCTVRTGSPARSAYHASLMFISGAWVRANPTIIIQRTPMGTGEHDIALLAITSSATTQPLPSTFPYLAPATSTPQVNTPVVIGSYAAQFLSLNEIQNSLYATIVYGHVKKVYTFATSTIDLISLGGTVAAQEGSSGGGVVNTNGALTGTITTSTVTGSTQKRDLHALTMTYIRRDYAQEMQQSLSTLLTMTPAQGVANFAQERKTLRSIIVQAISSQ